MLDIFRDRVRGIAHEFFNYRHYELNQEFNLILKLLREIREKLEKGRVSYTSLKEKCEYVQSLKNVGNIVPTSSVRNLLMLKDSEGFTLSPENYKKDIHDVMFRAMIEGFAAIGGVELLVDKGGNIIYLRLTPGGCWYSGLTPVLPRGEELIDVADAIEVDDRTGLITVKNPDYPNLAILPEFADKITETRWCFYEKAFMKNVDTPVKFTLKIKRFESFILSNPGLRMRSRFEKLKANCNVVRKTKGEPAISSLT